MYYPLTKHQIEVICQSAYMKVVSVTLNVLYCTSYSSCTSTTFALQKSFNAA